MEESLYAKMRGKGRFDVNLKGAYSMKQDGPPHKECRITNLSSSGATVYFPRTENLSNGSVVAIDIPIPKTIIRIAVEAEIMWTRERFSELISGIRFTGMLSDTIIRQLTKKTP